MTIPLPTDTNRHLEYCKKIYFRRVKNATPYVYDNWS